MQLIGVNEADLRQVPETARHEICRSALEGVMKARNDPEYQEKFRKWKEKRSGAA